MVELPVAAATPVQIKVDGGIVAGAVHDGVLSFKGIPFAAPPVGALRWRPPQPVSGWSAVRRAVSYGPDCMQVPFPEDAAPLRSALSEDCLYLNVWRPARASSKLPVMVWIYGGGFVNGGTSPAVYDGSQFARDDIVLVSFNYRLGNFGFFAHPALSAEQRGAALGNYAFMDQIAALQWVQRNSGAFGGDPANVTVFGESAGGASVHVLLTSPLARGLFRKAIIESAGGRPGVRVLAPLSGGAEAAEAIGVALARRFGVKGQGPEALARLRAVPAGELVSGLNMATAGRDATYVGGPILDGKLCLGAPTDLYAAGQGAPVPIMIGANSMDLGGDQRMLEPARAIARLLTARGQPVFLYRFSYVAESLRATLEGAPHASEIPFVFDTVAARYGKELTAADEAAARAVHRYWVAFAREGAPQVQGEPAWPAYDAQRDLIMDFTAHGPVAGPDPLKARLDRAERASERAERAKGGKGAKGAARGAVTPQDAP
jgi:para-nitrobenzyl esterase